MKKANFYWIIAAFCILRMADISGDATLVTYEKAVNSKAMFSFSAEDIVVSGRWMR